MEGVFFFSLFSSSPSIHSLHFKQTNLLACLTYFSVCQATATILNGRERESRKKIGGRKFLLLVLLIQAWLLCGQQADGREQRVVQPNEEKKKKKTGLKGAASGDTFLSLPLFFLFFSFFSFLSLFFSAEILDLPKMTQTGWSSSSFFSFFLFVRTSKYHSRAS